MKMNEYNLTDDKGTTVKKLGFVCPICHKVYSEVRMRYEKRTVTCTCGTKLDNPVR